MLALDKGYIPYLMMDPSDPGNFDQSCLDHVETSSDSLETSLDKLQETYGLGSFDQRPRSMVSYKRPMVWEALIRDQDLW